MINTGKDFEIATKETFELMGYEVERDLLISGTQIDLIIRKNLAGLLDIRVVECKDYKKKIGIALLKEFQATIHSVRKEFPEINGIFVSQLPLTKEAKKYADSVGIQCTTLSDLNNKLINLESYCKGIIEEFRLSELFQHYIESYAFFKPNQGNDTLIKNAFEKHKAQDEADNYINKRKPELDDVSRSCANESQLERILFSLDWLDKNEKQLKEKSNKKIDEEKLFWNMQLQRSYYRINNYKKETTELVMDWLLRGKSSSMIILGDYGTGKTSFIDKFTVKCSEYFLRQDNFRCPVRLNLKEYSNGISLNEFYDAIAAKLGCLEMDRKIIVKYFEMGRFLVLLDGFDEMSMQVNSRVRKIHFASLLNIMLIPNNKVLVTGRASYFPSEQHMKELLSFIENDKDTISIIRLAPFSEREISKYIDSYSTKISEEKINKIKYIIDNVYNLKDLAERPFLLNLIVRTFTEIEDENEVNDVTPALLYELYTRKWLERENKKGTVRWLITKNDKQKFMITIAWEMLKTNSLVVHYTQLSEWVKIHFKLTTYDEVDYFAHDIQTCSFLKRDDEGNYTFTHRSFMEYFVALKIVHEAEKNQITVDDLFKDIPFTSLTSNSIGFAFDLFGFRTQLVYSFVTTVFPQNKLANLFSILNKLPPTSVKNVVKILRRKKGYLKKLFNKRTADLYFFGKKYLYKYESDEVKYCDFCNLSQREVAKLIAGPSVYICENCVIDAGSNQLLINTSDEKIVFNHEDSNCSFCDKKGTEVEMMFSNHQVNDNKASLCDECLELCFEILIDDTEDSNQKSIA